MTDRPRGREIQRRKIHEDVTEYLLDDIKNGIYKVGEELPSERALMAEFGVGRPAIRESLSKLARMGLIEVRPGLRAKVCPVNAAPLLDEMTGTVTMALQSQGGQRHMQEIRTLFETAVARSVALSITVEQLAAIERLHRESEKALGDPARFAAYDVRFHRAMGEATNNPLVTAIFDAFGKWLLAQRLENFKKPERPRIAFEFHGKILEALGTRDPDAVEQAVRAHLADVSRTYWSIQQSDTKGADAS